MIERINLGSLTLVAVYLDGSDCLETIYYVCSYCNEDLGSNVHKALGHVCRIQQRQGVV